jgi:hypothetical protein
MLIELCTLFHHTSNTMINGIFYFTREHTATVRENSVKDFRLKDFESTTFTRALWPLTSSGISMIFLEASFRNTSVVDIERAFAFSLI